jgi:hypothetical protein
MRADTEVIQMAVAVKLFAQYQSEFSEDRAATIAAAVSNKLFGRISPDHTDEDLMLADQLSAETLRSDFEIRYASVMSCRARLLFEAERNSEERWKIWDTIQWMETICDLPPDEAEPAVIRQLATSIHGKYVRKT